MALTELFLRRVKYTGSPTGDRYSDGRALYLLVKAANKYWRMNYRYGGKQKTLTIGAYPEVPLAIARERCTEAHKLLRLGVDPQPSKTLQGPEPLDEDRNTFAELSQLWLTKLAPDHSPNTIRKLSNWLDHDVLPILGGKPAASIKPRDILATLQKMETRGAIDSAHRVKQMCGQILRFGVALGWVERDVTPDLKGALAAVPAGNFAAITEPKEVAGLLRAIYGYGGHVVVVAALKLSPLLFVRPGELRAAEWAEFDLDVAEWRIPAAKMKMKKEHLVPLADQSVEILRQLQRVTGDGKFVFPGFRRDEVCMSENAINAALRNLGFPKEVMSAHGFRAMARTILDEVLGERVDLIEHQLAHRVMDPNGRAYNRTAHLPARREMMQRWADYLDQLRAGADVILIRPVN
ncbi:tyrosine-type recombinase/integrase [Rugamonas apoptosis]|uniref:Integrase arm-type DNA-binding domain-containing protein n=1 Tax=Rugamonas apoptosis TaxID=2758570 RepID=A0A7W2FB02_9BURK|nr:integrase arm-type DNA-binding domain-containing protein [Rugamonas apoptosis]MBA5688269.1 integrase arm-type DNA-binding domain-containing protein [Rugamonas apoptosis]